jgi:hypothetical protein
LNKVGFRLTRIFFAETINLTLPSSFQPFNFELVASLPAQSSVREELEAKQAKYAQLKALIREKQQVDRQRDKGK